MKRYTIVIEQTPNNYSAYVLDLPGCVTTGSSIEETVANMREAISLHLETMADLGIPIPEPATLAESLPDNIETRQVEVAA
jgi:predicted RNase H-like HicB family nuclease